MSVAHSKPLVVLTRPPGKNEALQTSLSQQGIDALIFPLLTRTPIDLSAEERTHLFNLDHFQWVISLSDMASQCFLEQAEACWPQWPVGIQYWAIGDAAARPLQQAGLTVSIPQTSTSEGLLEALPKSLSHQGSPQQSQPHQKVLLLKGVGGRTLLAESLKSRSFDVHYLSLYQRVGLPKPAELDQCWDQLKTVLITSNEAFEQWHNWVEGLPQWQNKHYIVPSDRIANYIRQQGCSWITLSGGADDASTLKAIASI